MTCFNPISLKPVYIVDERTGEVTDTPGRNVPCGKCVGCLNQKRSYWTQRLQNEVKNSTKAVFITLTYDDESLPYVAPKISERKVIHACGDGYDDKEYVTFVRNLLKHKLPTLKKRDLQLYFKRIRKYEKNLKYYAVGEYGSETQRPHYHALVIGVEDNLLVDKWTGEKANGEESEPLGFVRIDRISDALIHYLTKYIINDDNDKYGDRQKPFAIMSKGLGKRYIDEAGIYHRNAQTTISTAPGGIKYNIARYYRERIFSKEERDEISKKSRESISEGERYKKNAEFAKSKKAIIRKAQLTSKSKKV